jgi:hypothetical protein
VPLLPVCFQLVDDGTDVRDYLEERKKWDSSQNGSRIMTKACPLRELPMDSGWVGRNWLVCRKLSSQWSPSYDLKPQLSNERSPQHCVSASSELRQSSSNSRLWRWSFPWPNRNDVISLCRRQSGYHSQSVGIKSSHRSNLIESPGQIKHFCFF